LGVGSLCYVSYVVVTRPKNPRVLYWSRCNVSYVRYVEKMMGKRLIERKNFAFGNSQTGTGK